MLKIGTEIDFSSFFNRDIFFNHCEGGFPSRESAEEVALLASGAGLVAPMLFYPTIDGQGKWTSGVEIPCRLGVEEKALLEAVKALKTRGAKIIWRVYN